MKPYFVVNSLAQIAARIEKERAIVESNRELIRIYEAKVKQVAERVWES